MQRGTIARWTDRGFGFIRPEVGKTDVFVHISQLADSLKGAAATGSIEGTRVEYDIESVPGQKTRAINVRGVVLVPSNLTRILPVDWQGANTAYVHDAWNRKNPRGSDYKCRLAMETGEYFQVYADYSGKYHGRAVAHKSLQGLLAMVVGLFIIGRDEPESALYVDESTQIGYAFIPSVPQRVSAQVWQQAAAFAGLKEIRLVVAEKFNAYMLTADDWMGSGKERLAVRKVSGLVYDGIVRHQGTWGPVELQHVPSELLSPVAARAMKEWKAEASDAYQRRNGLAAEAYLDLYKVWGTARACSTHELRCLDLLLPPSADLVDAAVERCRDLVSVRDKDPIKGWGIAIETASEGTQLLVGWARFGSGRTERVAISKAWRTGSGWSGKACVAMLRLRDLGALDDARIDLYDQPHNTAERNLIIAGAYAQSTDLDFEALRIRREADEAARQKRIAEAGKPFVRINGPFAEIVEYDSQGDEVVLDVAGWNIQDRYNYYFIGKRQDQSEVRIKLTPGSAEATAASRTWESYRPKCPDCGEPLFTMGPSYDPSKQWQTCENHCDEKRNRRRGNR